MKSRKVKWSIEECEELMDLVKAHKGNLNVAFAAFHCANKDRSIYAIQKKWYNDLRSQVPKRICMASVTRKKKSVTKSAPVKEYKPSLLERIWYHFVNKIF